MPAPGLLRIRHLPPSRRARFVAHAGDAEAIFLHGLRIEADAAVADFDPQPFAALEEADDDRVALAVVPRVGEALLHDAIDDVFQGGGQAPEGDVAAEAKFRTTLERRTPWTRCAMVATTPDSSRIGGRTPLTSRRASASRRGGAGEEQAAVESLLGLVGLQRVQLVEDLELHQCAGDFLCQSVVNVMRR